MVLRKSLAEIAGYEISLQISKWQHGLRCLRCPYGESRVVGIQVALQESIIYENLKHRVMGVACTDVVLHTGLRKTRTTDTQRRLDLGLVWSPCGWHLEAKSMTKDNAVCLAFFKRSI